MKRAPGLCQETRGGLASRVRLEKQQTLGEVSAATDRLWQTTNMSISLGKTVSSHMPWTQCGAKPLGVSKKEGRRSHSVRSTAPNW